MIWLSLVQIKLENLKFASFKFELENWLILIIILGNNLFRECDRFD